MTGNGSAAAAPGQMASQTAARFRPFGTTIFAEMTALAREHGAVNLSQGFPDFDGPDVAKAAARAAIEAGENQYAPLAGRPELLAAVARSSGATLGFEIDAAAEVTVTPGCTGALAAVMLGLLEPGDEVVLFEPYYDSYRAAVAMAGAVPRFVALREGGGEAGDGFGFDVDELRAAFGPRTRAVVVNTPHNPTGKVFTREELGQIAALCCEHDVIAVSDVVYERLVFAGEHVSIASFDGMRERSVVCSSLGKTYSLTGWKVGWAIAPARLTAGIRAAHQFLTFSVPGPLQLGAVAALEHADGYVAGMLESFREAHRRLATALAAVGFDVKRTDGTYFVMVDHRRVSAALGVGGDVGGDVEMARYMEEHVGVAVVPPSFFYERRELGEHLLRFCFCKRLETIDAAAERIRERLGGVVDGVAV